jgi:hypothetical protein
VHERDGVEYYQAAWTGECTGCTERGEMGGTKYGPFGCDECGYTGKRRITFLIPFDPSGVTQFTRVDGSKP